MNLGLIKLRRAFNTTLLTADLLEVAPDTEEPDTEALEDLCWGAIGWRKCERQWNGLAHGLRGAGVLTLW